MIIRYSDYSNEGAVLALWLTGEVERLDPKCRQQRQEGT